MTSLLYIPGTIWDDETLKARKNRITRTVTVWIWGSWHEILPQHYRRIASTFQADDA